MPDDLSSDTISEEEKKEATISLEEKRDRVNHKKLLFYAILFVLFVLYVFAGIITCESLLSPSPVPTTNTIIVITLIMVPTILTLALMRFLFGNNNQSTEKNIPSISFNIGKELLSLGKELIKKD
jgi:hypothetical protein